MLLLHLQQHIATKKKSSKDIPHAVTPLYQITKHTGASRVLRTVKPIAFHWPRQGFLSQHIHASAISLSNTLQHIRRRPRELRSSTMDKEGSILSR